MTASCSAPLACTTLHAPSALIRRARISCPVLLPSRASQRTPPHGDAWSTLAATSACSKRLACRRFRVVSVAAAAAAAATAAPSAWAANAPAISQILTSSGLFLLCLAASIFLIASLPAVWHLARVAMRMHSVLSIVEQELPQSAALLRLSGLEVTDCISEISGLGSELTSGIRSTANLATMAEQGVKQGIAGVQQGLVPMVAKGEKHVRGVVEEELRQRAKLTHTKEMLHSVGQLAGATTLAVRRVRFGVGAVALARAAVDAGLGLRQLVTGAARRNYGAGPGRRGGPGGRRGEAGSGSSGSDSDFA